MSAAVPSPSFDLKAATAPYAQEFRAWSWWSLWSTLLLVGLGLTWCALPLWWPLRLAASAGTALLLVRLFILFHDYQHGSILRRSRLAKAVMHAIGLFMMTPSRSWRASHDFHHAHVGKPEHSHVGSFPILTVQQWHQRTFWQRVALRVHRHPLVLIGAYFTVFLLNITLLPALRRPIRHYDSILSLLIHAACITTAALLGGWSAVLFVVLLPMILSGAFGAYLFWVQHNHPDIRILDAARWSRNEASLDSSSYLKLGPVMRYLTGNIGYHHIHHANHHIPFYRLPEVMAAVPELAPRVTARLTPWQVVRSLRLHLWSESESRLVGWREARRLAA